MVGKCLIMMVKERTDREFFFFRLTGTRTAEQSLYDSCHRHRGRNLFTFHSSSRSDERIQSSGIERTKRSPQVALVPVRVHRRDGKGLYLCRGTFARGCPDGQGLGSQANGLRRHKAHGSR